MKNLRIERPDGSALTDQPEQWHGNLVWKRRSDLQTGVELGPPSGCRLRCDTNRQSVSYSPPPGCGSILARFRFRLRMDTDLRIDAAYVHVFVASRSINVTSQTGDLLTGRYSSRIDIISLSATMSFQETETPWLRSTRKSRNRGSNVSRHGQRCRAGCGGAERWLICLR